MFNKYKFYQRAFRVALIRRCNRNHKYMFVIYIFPMKNYTRSADDYFSLENLISFIAIMNYSNNHQPLIYPTIHNFVIVNLAALGPIPPSAGGNNENGRVTRRFRRGNDNELAATGTILITAMTSRRWNTERRRRAGQ